MCRCLRSHGLDCILVCPSKVPPRALRWMRRYRVVMGFMRLQALVEDDSGYLTSCGRVYAGNG